jgi:hypothetical protein
VTDASDASCPQRLSPDRRSPVRVCFAESFDRCVCRASASDDFTPRSDSELPVTDADVTRLSLKRARVCRLVSSWFSAMLLGLGDRRWHPRLSRAPPASVTRLLARKASATSPLLSTFGVKKIGHFHSSKMPESCLASSAGGKEDPKPLSTAQTQSPSLMCQHHHVYITICMCVSIFTSIFQSVMLALLPDPNAYAQEDDLVALDL